MPNFVFIYHGGKTPETPEEGAKTMAARVAWMDQIGDARIDRGTLAKGCPLIAEGGSVEVAEAIQM